MKNDWKAKQVDITGLKNLKNSFGNWSNQKKDLGIIYDGIKEIVKPVKITEDKVAEKLDTKGKFSYFYKKKNATEATINKSIDIYTKRFYIMLCSFLISCLILPSSELLSVISVVKFSILTTMMLILFQSAYYVYILKNRDLVSPFQFLKRFELPYIKLPKIPFIGMFSLVAGTALMVTGNAFADSPINFAMHPLGDFPGQMMTAISGVQAGSDVSKGNEFTELLGIFSELLFFLASVGMSYQVIIGLLQTAHEGEVLGKRWSTFFAPLRVVIGTSFIVPIAAMGSLNLLQLTLTDVVGAGGSNFASMASKDGISKMLNTSGKSASFFTDNEDFGGQKLAHNILQNEICFESHDNDPAKDTTLNIKQPSSDGFTGDGYTYFDYGNCGSFSIPNTQDINTSSKYTSDEDLKQATSTFVNARKQAVKTLIDGIRNNKMARYMARSQVPGLEKNDDNTWPDNYMEAIQTLVGQYNTNIFDAANAFQNSVEKNLKQATIDTVDKYGWLALGPAYIMMSQNKAQVLDIASVNFSYEQPQLALYNNISAYFSDKISNENNTLKRTQIVEDKMNEQWEEATKTSSTLTGADMSTIGKSNSGAIVDKILKVVSAKLASITYGDGNSDDPLGHEVVIGHRLLLAGEGLLGTTALAGTLAGASIAMIPTFIGMVNMFLAPLFLGLMGTAFMLIVLPLLPFMYLEYSYVAYTMFYTEAMIVASLYAMLWVRMDGDDLMTEIQRAGFRLIVNLFFTPILTVLSFFATTILVKVLLNQFNALFPIAYTASQSGHYTGPLLMLFGLVLQGYMQYQITVRCLSFIVDCRTHAFLWLGINARSYNEGDMGHKTTANALVAGNQITNESKGLAGKAKPFSFKKENDIKKDNKTN